MSDTGVPLLVLNGRDQTAEVYPDRVRIVNRLIKSDSDFYYRLIQSVVMNQPTLMWPMGFILLAPLGYSPKYKQNPMELAKAANAVVFRRGDLEVANSIRRYIESRIADLATPTARTPLAASAPDLADQIRRLGDLRDQGLLTADEFADKKAELLRRM